MSGTQKSHPLHPKLNLLALLCSGEKKKEYQVDFPKILQNFYRSMVATNKTKIHFKLRKTCLIKKMQIYSGQMK